MPAGVRLRTAPPPPGIVSPAPARVPLGPFAVTARYPPEYGAPAGSWQGRTITRDRSDEPGRLRGSNEVR